MSERPLQDPKQYPVDAAHEVVIELIRSEALICSSNNSYGTTRGEQLADAAITAHKKLVEYYKSLD
ncbi:hypothetical protein SAMN04487958_11499 [Vreelandella subterranea]|uniref:Uncharacterized protein n=1 Tax=Vreelandella subterranea TaxID=416874 RepID=A0A1H9WG80_9GAMM|nr:hypothetical protein SAMN04487958_11499 [Halomonas subterranea]